MWSAPSRATTFFIALNGTSSFRSVLRICSTLVSSRTFAVDVLRLNVTAHVVSAPITTPSSATFRFALRASHSQQFRPLRRRKALDRIPYRCSRNRWAVRAQVTFQPSGVSFPGFAEHPPDRFLKQIFPVAVKPPGDFVSG